MAKQTSGTGQGGKSFQDRELAASVRALGLKEIEKVLMQKDMDEFKKQVILRLAGSLLPRLNEHSGEGGGPVAVQISEVIANKNNIS